MSIQRQASSSDPQPDIQPSKTSSPQKSADGEPAQAATPVEALLAGAARLAHALEGRGGPWIGFILLTLSPQLGISPQQWWACFGLFALLILCSSPRR